MHGDDRRQAEREQRAGGPDADREIFAQEVRDRRVLKQRLGADQRGVHDEEDRGRKAMPGGPRLEVSPLASPEPPTASSASPAATHEMASWAALNTTARADGGGPGRPRARRRPGRPRPRAARRSEAERRRTAWRSSRSRPRGTGSGTARRREPTRGHPELGVGGAEVADPGDRERDEHRDARGAYESQIEGEGVRGRHRGESRRNDVPPRAWAEPVAARSERPICGRDAILRAAPSASSRTSRARDAGKNQVLALRANEVRRSFEGITSS